MSIRIKILLILVLGILVALTVSILAYINAQKLDHDIEEILNQDLRASQALSQAREALREVSKAEERMVSRQELRYQAELEGSMKVVIRGIEEGQRLAPDVASADRFLELRQAAEAYGKALEAMVELLRSGQSRVGTRLKALRTKAQRAQEEVRALRRRVEEAASKPDGSEDVGAESGPNRALVAEMKSLEASLERLAGVRLQFADVGSGDLEEEFTEEVEEVVGGVWLVWRRLAPTLGASGFRTAMARLEPQLVSLEQDGVLLQEAVREISEQARELRRTSRGLFTSLESGLSERAQQAWRQLEAKRTAIGERRSLAINVIIVILVVGLLLVGALGAVLTRGMTRSVSVLLDAARDIRQGDLDAHVTIRTRDELHELAEAFNAMAYYLKARRKQQLDYNEIVSLLNSTLSLDEILAGSLRETIERSGSLAGAVYLYESHSERLVLRESYALSMGPERRRELGLGEGLVGQAAKTRRKILVTSVPEGSFDVDLGVGLGRPGVVLVLPVVHVEHLLGVFVLAASAPYDDEVLTFIEEVVFQVGVTLNNARFVETIEETARELRDKTDELIAQQSRLEKVNHELEDANRLKDDFLANVTHELRTPLNAIIGFTELVSSREGLEEKPRRHLETVLRNARSLLAMINDLLDITKIEAGKASLAMERVDVAGLVEECLHTVRPMVESDTVTLESKLEPGLPRLTTDRGKLRQVLLNLLSNAAKFTEEGAIRVDVRLASTSEVEFAVIDSGIGIHEEDLPFIFDKFRQVDGSSSRKYSGTGLGLAITSELVKLIGGTISARSEVGGGSTFRVLLPVVASQSPGVTPLALEARVEDEVEAEASEVGEVAPGEVAPVRRRRVTTTGLEPVEATQRGTILVLDDNPGSVVALRQGLRNDEFKVASAFIYADAASLLESDEPVEVVVLGKPLPEDDEAGAFSRLVDGLREQGVGVVWLGDAERDVGEVVVHGKVERPLSVDALETILET